MQITDGKGRTYSLDDDILGNEIEAIEAEAARRENRPPRREGRAFFHYPAHPDLEARRERAYDEADARFRRPRNILVKPGDWVRINGYRFRVGRVDARTAVIDTERVGAEGRVVSSAPANGEGLAPDTSAEPDRDDLRPPVTLRDGYDRARWVLKAHRSALGDRAV